MTITSNSANTYDQQQLTIAAPPAAMAEGGVALAPAVGGSLYDYY